MFVRHGEKPGEVSKPHGVNHHVIVWHHGTMAKIVRHFPVVNGDDVPKRWPDDRFDLIWILVREPGAELSYRFVAVPQRLLADDLETA